MKRRRIRLYLLSPDPLTRYEEKILQEAVQESDTRRRTGIDGIELDVSLYMTWSMALKGSTRSRNKLCRSIINEMSSDRYADGIVIRREGHEGESDLISQLSRAMARMKRPYGLYSISLVVDNLTAV